jgi:hypothetical protein
MPEVTIIASDDELSAAGRVWGSGGWDPPEDRRALDWLTFARLLGWTPRVIGASGSSPRTMSRIVVLACEHEELDPSFIEGLEEAMRLREVLIVSPPAGEGSDTARLFDVARDGTDVETGQLFWTEGDERLDLGRVENTEVRTVVPSADSRVLAQLEDRCVITSRPFERGRIATIGVGPGVERERAGAVHAALLRALVQELGEPVAWFDLSGTVVLRMDDPGGAQNLYSRSWSYPKLSQKSWSLVSDELQERDARLSIGYVSGWVDDGDEERGHLVVNGGEPPRLAGAIHASSSVLYEDVQGHTPGTMHDYVGEQREIAHLKRIGRGDVELHGYTHMHPDLDAWARAPDRYDNVAWFRELGASAQAFLDSRPGTEHPIRAGLKGLQESFDTFPTTLICPGDEWTNSALEEALDAGMQFVSSYNLALRDGDRFCWAYSVCSPYLDRAERAWFDSPMPIVGYFHDYELSKYGVEWFSKWLDEWAVAGARRFIDFRGLASIVSRSVVLEQTAGDDVKVLITGDRTVDAVAPFEIAFSSGSSPMPDTIRCELDSVEVELSVQDVGDGVGRVAVFPDGKRDLNVRS